MRSGNKTDRWMRLGLLLLISLLFLVLAAQCSNDRRKECQAASCPEGLQPMWIDSRWHDECLCATAPVYK